ncbi:hypothetical protein TNCV_2915071 [Trichonephila clavipes]|nr:hypothetical protein TNCV_2915071 [Trichonephila clavipes]
MAGRDSTSPPPLGLRLYLFVLAAALFCVRRFLLHIGKTLESFDDKVLLFLLLTEPFRIFLSRPLNPDSRDPLYPIISFLLLLILLFSDQELGIDLISGPR